MNKKSPQIPRITDEHVFKYIHSQFDKKRFHLYPVQIAKSLPKAQSFLKHLEFLEETEKVTRKAEYSDLINNSLSRLQSENRIRISYFSLLGIVLVEPVDLIESSFSELQQTLEELEVDSSVKNDLLQFRLTSTMHQYEDSLRRIIRGYYKQELHIEDKIRPNIDHLLGTHESLEVLDDEFNLIHVHVILPPTSCKDLITAYELKRKWINKLIHFSNLQRVDRQSLDNLRSELEVMLSTIKSLLKNTLYLL
jgi:hypothetical protein